MKIQATVRQCEVGKCDTLWLETDHDPERNECDICGRDICNAHGDHFKLNEKMVKSAFHSGFRFDLGRVCTECSRDILRAERGEMQEVMREFIKRKREKETSK
jgi:hypothetical protein